MDNTRRFDGLAGTYAKGRPAYPAELVGRLAAWAELGPESVVADVGAGTGIFSAQLPTTGAQVVAVEPNDGMRAQAELALAGIPGASVAGGTAEHTGLSDASADLVTAAQAFHWFDGVAFRDECLRILRGPARVCLVWNVRVEEAPVNVACKEAFTALCPRFKGFTGGVTRHDPRVVEFFRGSYDLWAYDVPLTYAHERFVERCCSGSYAPRPGEERHAEFLAAVEAIYERFHATDGSITVPNETLAYVGTLR